MIETVYRLKKDTVYDLQATGKDQLAISRQQISSTSDLDPECVISVEERTFYAALKDCDPYIEVKIFYKLIFLVYRDKTCNRNLGLLPA